MSGIAERRRAARTESKDQYNTRRAELIRIAADVFKEKGYDGATLNDVAERFGAERASLYYYVSGKEELFQEAVRGMLEENVSTAERIRRRDGDAEAKLVALIEQVILSYDENYPYTYLYIQEDMRRVGAGRTEWAREMTRQTRRMESISITLIEQGVVEGAFRQDVPPRLAANALWGMLNWTHRWYRPNGEISSREMIEGFTAVFIDGLRRR